jgi:hypothetical protein
MTTDVTAGDIRHELEIDFDLVRVRLIEARLRQQAKDTPANRAAVAEYRTRMDTVLDLLLELGEAGADE